MKKAFVSLSLAIITVMLAGCAAYYTGYNDPVYGYAQTKHPGGTGQRG